MSVKKELEKKLTHHKKLYDKAGREKNNDLMRYQLGCIDTLEFALRLPPEDGLKLSKEDGLKLSKFDSESKPLAMRGVIDILYQEMEDCDNDTSYKRLKEAYNLCTDIYCLLEWRLRGYYNS